MAKTTCRVDGCERDDKMVRGWCCMHYSRWVRRGTTIDADSPIARFHRKFESRERWACWEWTGPKFKKGYAQFWDGERNLGGHRWAYEQFIGPVADGLVLDHICENKGCVNPWHLEPVTNQENLQRSKNTNHGKTHCRNGHPFSGDNLIVTKHQRRCRTCKNAQDLASHHRRNRERKTGQR